jgi:GAF domain-containing protein
MSDSHYGLEQGAGSAIGEALEIARQALGMEAGYVTQFTEGEQVYRELAGDAGSFDMRLNEGYRLDGSYCLRMALGEIPNVVNDSAQEAGVRDLAITKLGDIGAYVGVPIYFSDGKVYGSVCTVSHEARPELGERDMLVLKAVARLIGAELERVATLRHNEELAARVAELEAEVAELRDAVQAAEASGGDFVDARGWRPD